ncbi:hypothetical protein QTP70_031643 [Hemibagrus guttatus]|uniref:ribonuclease H n=1 Tax=Hemibagrus guttatus TaxID=175788 RepID=A0AAE0REP6_9TELE|nr:hypothetical protein QTP70_031643 [Hemibagrus guttatus]
MPQVFINEIFKDLINRYVITYINDMLIYFASYDDHVHHIRMVLSRLLQHHLYVKAEKFIRIPSCSSGISSRRGEWRWTPARFNYNSITNPLTSFLHGKPRQMQWTEQAQAAFMQLKRSFTTALILRHPDRNLPFIVEVDTFSCGIGAVMSQRHGNMWKIYS